MARISLLTCLYVICLLYHGDAAKITDETAARQWLEDYNVLAQDAYYQNRVAYWRWNTNLTSHNQALLEDAQLVMSLFRKEASANASKFDWKNFQDNDIKRQFGKIYEILEYILPSEKVTQIEKLRNNMLGIYSTGKVCNRPGDTSGKCYPLDPDLTNIMATSEDWDELLWAWKGWRDSTGKLMKDTYEQKTVLSNEAGVLNGYSDFGEYLKSWYEMEGFEAECDRLWAQVKPLYQQLHAYVRRKLQERYPDKEFPSTGHIPAHLLGNMWAQSWANLYDLVEPFKGKPALDITPALKEKVKNSTNMMRVAEEFFTSIGLSPMPENFWENSLFDKPKDRDVVCHASAWDFFNGKDYRIKQCTEMTQEWLITTHHEMGHIQYDLQYKDQPVVYRRGGNPGFHEAIGDVMALSVSTPEHLQEIGLLDEISSADDTEADINFLMSMALKKIAFLPFGFLMDQWRWKVFDGSTTKSNYNSDWWKVRCKYQGVSPPVERSEADFDAGAKYHIPGDTPYIRYFISHIIQFQFQKALCEAAGNTKPLHRCDIYKSTQAGTKLGDMLKLGSSLPWQDSFEKLTSTRTMDASAVLEYFQPLITWLEEQNKGFKVTWDENCPDMSANSGIGLNLSFFAFTAILVCHLVKAL